MDDLYSTEEIDNGLKGDRGHGFCDPGSYLSKSGKCNFCAAESGENFCLKTCTRCTLVKYCSRDCQKEDFKKHKTVCKGIKNLAEMVERLGARLHSIKCLNWPRQNLFECQVGRFWKLWEPRDYCVARYQFADEVYTLGKKSNSKNMSEISLSHFMELMRLSYGDNQVTLIYKMYI